MFFHAVTVLVTRHEPQCSLLTFRLVPGIPGIFLVAPTICKTPGADSLPSLFIFELFYREVGVFLQLVDRCIFRVSLSRYARPRALARLPSTRGTLKDIFLRSFLSPLRCFLPPSSQRLARRSLSMVTWGLKQSRHLADLETERLSPRPAIGRLSDHCKEKGKVLVTSVFRMGSRQDREGDKRAERGGGKIRYQVKSWRLLKLLYWTPSEAHPVNVRGGSHSGVPYPPSEWKAIESYPLSFKAGGLVRVTGVEVSALIVDSLDLKSHRRIYTIELRTRNMQKTQLLCKS